MANRPRAAANSAKQKAVDSGKPSSQANLLLGIMVLFFICHIPRLVHNIHYS